MKDLTPYEETNLKTFSSERVVKELYSSEGFTALEKYLAGKYLSGSQRILDMGCGTGRTTVPLKDMGMDVVGIDLSREMIRAAKEKRPDIDFRVMNACQLEFGDASFDHVLFSFNGIDCVHPVEKRVKCLKEVLRVLKKGGTFIFSSHNALGIPGNRESLGTFLKNVFSMRVFGHYREEDSPGGKLYLYYGVPSVERKILRGLGFKIIEVVGKRRGTGFWGEFLELALYYVVTKV